MPKVPLAEGDYLIWLRQSDQLRTAEHTLFRVGSLARVVRVYFRSQGETHPIDEFGIEFSEAVKVRAVANSLRMRVRGQKHVLALLNKKEQGRIVGFKPSSNLDFRSLVDIELDSNIGLGARLDSQYKGAPSVSPFALSVRPADLGADMTWRRKESY